MILKDKDDIDGLEPNNCSLKYIDIVTDIKIWVAGFENKDFREISFPKLTDFLQRVSFNNVAIKSNTHLIYFYQTNVSKNSQPLTFYMGPTFKISHNISTIFIYNFYLKKFTFIATKENSVE